MGNIEDKNKVTDWNKYYAKPFPAANFTRKLTQRKILEVLWRHNTVKNPEILELGGANSSFAEPITDYFDAERYLAVDNNQYGLDLMHSIIQRSDKIDVKFGDALALSESQEDFDIVFSVGLIEHFTPNLMKRCIATHFKRCRSGGIVLVTFPTPTFLYWMIRKPAEWIRVWAFPDEKPLTFIEVALVCDQYGIRLHQSINWAIGLTQGYLVYRKS